MSLYPLARALSHLSCFGQGARGDSQELQAGIWDGDSPGAELRQPVTWSWMDKGKENTGVTLGEQEEKLEC